MKKLIAIILTLCVLFSLAACSGGSETANNDPVNDTSSKPKPLGSAVTGSDDSSDSSGSDDEVLNIEYKSVAEGYISENGSSIVKFKGFQCMDDEYIFIPKGTNILTDKHCAIFCYKLSGEALELDINACKSIGSSITASGYGVQHSAGTYQAVESVWARISVKGSLKDDVQIFPPKDKIGEVKVITGAELIEELKK